MSDCFKWCFGSKRNEKKSESRERELYGHVSDRTPPIVSKEKLLDSAEREITRSFVSPNGLRGNDIEKHSIRLRERGYEVLKLLGFGAYGKCYEVIDLKHESKRKLVVKIMYLGEFDKDANLFDDFSNEVWILKKAPHPNIITLIDHFIYDRIHTYTVLELMDKGTLEEVLKSSDKLLSENQTKMYFFQTSRAIDHLHRMGIAHRDIKLSNILISSLPNGKQLIKVADFGLSRVSYKSNYGTVMINRPAGTLYYMSPQMLALYVMHDNKPTSTKLPNRTDPFKADIWSLGVCFYYMIVKEYPFQDSNWSRNNDRVNLAKSIYKKQMRRNIGFPKNISSNLSQECHNLLLDTLEFDKEKRIQICGIVRNIWFDEWLDREKVEDINKIDLLKFIDQYQDF